MNTNSESAKYLTELNQRLRKTFSAHLATDERIYYQK